MTAYKPPQASLLKRLTGHWLIQLCAVTAALAAVAWFVQSREQLALQTHIDRVTNAPDSRAIEPKTPDAPAPKAPALRRELRAAAAPQQATEPVEPRQSSDAANVAYALHAPDEEDAQPAPSQTPTQAPAQTPVAQAAPSAAPAGATPTKLRLMMGEFRRSFILELIASAREEGSLNAYAGYDGGAAQLPDLLARLARESLGASNVVRPITLNQPILVEGMRESKGMTVGLNLTVTPTSVDETQITVNAELARAIRGETGTVQITTFPETFLLRGQRFGFMSGAIPHRPIAEAERELYSMTPLKILSSDQFRTGVSEFAVIFLPQ